MKFLIVLTPNNTLGDNMEFQLKWTQTGSYEKLWLQIYEGLIPDFAVAVQSSFA